MKSGIQTDSKLLFESSPIVIALVGVTIRTIFFKGYDCSLPTQNFAYNDFCLIKQRWSFLIELSICEGLFCSEVFWLNCEFVRVCFVQKFSCLFGFTSRCLKWKKNNSRHYVKTNGIVVIKQIIKLIPKIPKKLWKWLLSHIMVLEKEKRFVNYPKIQMIIYFFGKYKFKKFMIVCWFSIVFWIFLHEEM